MAKNKSNRSYKELLLTFGPAIALVIAGFWVASKFITPPPPKKIVISTGSESGAYYRYAQQYRDILAENGITVEINTSAGSRENIERLLEDKADVAFVQGGTARDKENLISLGSLYYEPIWIFLHKKVQPKLIHDFSKLRIAIGAEGGGTRIAATQFLQLNHIDQHSTKLLPLSGQDAADRLARNEIDVAFFVSSADTAVIQSLLHNESVYLFNLERTEAYSRLLPYLSKISLVEGVADIRLDIPPSDINMLAPTANLVVKEEFNDALIVLLLQAMKKVHSGANIFTSADTFPSAHKLAFPISDVAERFYKVGPPFLMRYLPFWPAIFIDRMIVLIIPLLVLLLPLIKITPPIYNWRIRSKIYRLYKELQNIDTNSFSCQLTVEQFNKIRRELERIEQETYDLKIPLSYSEKLYNLLLHIDLLKHKLKCAEDTVSPENA
jgi:TRAP-type uncharacterized transport system substrate-binding protein